MPNCSVCGFRIKSIYEQLCVNRESHCDSTKHGLLSLIALLRSTKPSNVRETVK